MESYILKVYRRGNRDKNQVVGLLEGLPTGTQENFRTFEELRDLLLDATGQKSRITKKNTNSDFPE